MKGGEAMENGVFRLGCEESHEGEIEWFVLCCVVLCFVGFGFGFLCGEVDCDVPLTANAFL